MAFVLQATRPLFHVFYWLTFCVIACVLVSYLVFFLIFGGTLLKKLRQRLYGIVLKNSESEGTPVVQEYVFCGPGSLKSPPFVTAEVPDEHPGLMTLWKDPKCPINEKWKLFCWAISKKIQVENVTSLPPYLQLIALALFYLQHEVKRFMTWWEVGAFVVQAVLIMKGTTDQERGIRDAVPKALPLHLSTVYQRTCALIQTVSHACGDPLLSSTRDDIFFDGKTFQFVYAKMERGTPGEHICGSESLAYDKVMSFLFAEEKP